MFSTYGGGESLAGIAIIAIVIGLVCVIIFGRKEQKDFFDWELEVDDIPERVNDGGKEN